MSFRKPEPLTVGDDLDPPTLSVRQFDADEEHEKAAKIAEKARQVLHETTRNLPDALSDAVTGHLRVPMPDREAAADDVGQTADELVEGAMSHFDELRSYLVRTLEDALAELPDVRSGPAAPGESDVRRWVREAPPDERMDRIRTVVESGNPEQARALFRDTIPAPAAGFPNEATRRRLRDEALRAAAPEPFETARSLGQDLEALTEDRRRVEFYADQLAQSAMTTFDHELAKFEARK